MKTLLRKLRDRAKKQEAVTSTHPIDQKPVKTIYLEPTPIVTPAKEKTAYCPLLEVVVDQEFSCRNCEHKSSCSPKQVEW
jgi:hypothetical protein